MRVEIITVGDELLFGKTVNTNAAFIAEQLTDSGAQVARVTTVGDTVSDIVEALQTAGQRYDVVIVTGGLGPTPDDVTRQAMAEAFQRKLVFDDEIYREIEQRWLRRGQKLPGSARLLATVPEGARMIRNGVGTAAGLEIQTEKALFLLLPGVPDEMRSMMDDHVIPLVRERTGGQVIHHLTLRTAGIGESAIQEKLAGIEDLPGQVAIAYLPQTYEVHLRLTTLGKSAKEAEERLSAAEKVVRNRLSYYIYAESDRTLEEVVADLLWARVWTLSVAESCSGGLIADRLTNVPGSSQFFKLGLVVYSEKAKQDVLSVPGLMLATYGAVSREVAVSMAEMVRRKGETNLGLSITGLMGPGGGDHVPVGTVYVGLACEGGSHFREYHFFGGRRANKLMAAQAALNELRLFLMGVIRAE